MASTRVPMPGRNTRSPAIWWLRAVALLAVLGFVGVFLVRDWGGISAGLRRLDGAGLAGAVGLALVGLLAAMLSWRAVLSGLGSRLPVLAAARVYFLSQLGKYVPGSVWPVLAQAELSRDYGVPRARAGFASVAQLLIGVVTGVIAAGATLAFSTSDALHTYWWLGFIAVAGVVAMTPAVFNRWVPLVFRAARRSPTLETVAPRTIAASAGWCFVMWAAFGAHAWVLARHMGADSPNLALLTTGAFALAWVVGFVIVVVPAGAGAREAALVLVLAPELGADGALALALVSRFVMLLGDGLTALAAAVAERSTLRKRPPG